MTQAFLDLTGLTRYHNNMKAVVVGSLSVSGTTVTFKNLNGTSLGTITTQDTTYSNATTSASGLMSSSDKSKLDNVASGAEVNVISTINITDGSGTAALTPSNKAVTIDLSGYALKTELPSGGITYKGQVQSYSSLPSSPDTGDMYNIVNADSTHGVYAGDNVIWDGSSWDVLTGTITFDTITTTQIDALFS